MFETVVFLLIQGHFICRVSHPEAHAYLERSDQRAEVEGYLARVGRVLSHTPQASGYYLSFARCGDTERATIRAHYTEFKGTLTPIVLFFNFLMRATGREDLLLHGAIIETANLMAQIDQDPGLRNDLQTVATVSKSFASDGTHRSMFERVLRKLDQDGYLKLVNAERKLYQVTSKVEYLLDVVSFLAESDETLRRAEEVAAAETSSPALL